jgi:hypothetical protein
MLLGLLTNPYSIATLVVIVTVLAVIRKVCCFQKIKKTSRNNHKLMSCFCDRVPQVACSLRLMISPARYFSSFLLFVVSFYFPISLLLPSLLSKMSLQYIIVTGGNTGLGLATAKLLAKMGKPTIIIGLYFTEPLSVFSLFCSMEDINPVSFVARCSLSRY